MHNIIVDQNSGTINKIKAMGQVVRLRALHLLLRAETPLCICELMDVLEKAEYQVSRCLTGLEKASLIQEERDGRLLFYSPVYGTPLNRLLFSVLDVADPDLAALFARDLEKLKKRLSLRQNGKVTVTYCSG